MTEGFAYQPDLVVLGFGLNDMQTWDGHSDLDYYARWRSLQPPSWLRPTHLGELVWAAWKARQLGGIGWGIEKAKQAALPPAQNGRPRLTPAEFQNVLERCRHACTERGVDVLLFTSGVRLNIDPQQPADLRTPLQEAQYEYCRRSTSGPGRAVACVDGVQIVQRLAQESPGEELFFDQVHPTWLTNQAIATALVDAIEESRRWENLGSGGSP